MGCGVSSDSTTTGSRSNSTQGDAMQIPASNPLLLHQALMPSLHSAIPPSHAAVADAHSSSPASPRRSSRAEAGDSNDSSPPRVENVENISTPSTVSLCSQGAVDLLPLPPWVKLSASGASTPRPASQVGMFGGISVLSVNVTQTPVESTRPQSAVSAANSTPRVVPPASSSLRRDGSNDALLHSSRAKRVSGPTLSRNPSGGVLSNCDSFDFQ